VSAASSLSLKADRSRASSLWYPGNYLCAPALDREDCVDLNEQCALLATEASLTRRSNLKPTPRQQLRNIRRRHRPAEQKILNEIAPSA